MPCYSPTDTDIFLKAVNGVPVDKLSADEAVSQIVKIVACVPKGLIAKFTAAAKNIKEISVRVVTQACLYQREEALTLH